MAMAKGPLAGGTGWVIPRAVFKKHHNHHHHHRRRRRRHHHHQQYRHHHQQHHHLHGDDGDVSCYQFTEAIA